MKARGRVTDPRRSEVRKMYKLFIGGALVRTESERYDPILDAKGKLFANVSRASRKDLREAVVKARDAFAGWSARSAYNRGQVLYRAAEMLEGRKAKFEDLLRSVSGKNAASARAEAEAAIDTFLYYAGWSDKFVSILGTVNPVASSYFDFSIPEPTGVVAIVAPDEPALAAVALHAASAVVSGNCAVVLLSEKNPLAGLELAEVVATSDFPAGVLNFLSGRREELLPPLARHRDVNAIGHARLSRAESKELASDAAMNVKRVREYALSPGDYLNPEKARRLDFIEDFVEIKTVWHPIGA